MYRYSAQIRQNDKSKFGFALQLNNEYFNSGFLFSYGGYVFGKNNTDDTDIGLSNGNAKLGAKVIWDLAGIMDEKCADDSFTNARTTMLANGTIFATICTPDITTNFLKDLALEYQNEGLSEAEANAAKIVAEGEAEYMKILSNAYNDEAKADFYLFSRSLDAARASLKNGETTLFLDENSPLAEIFSGVN